MEIILAKIVTILLLAGSFALICAGLFRRKLKLSQLSGKLLLLSVSGEGVSGICGKVLGELDRFTESALDDDIALVSLEFLRGRS